MKKNYYIKFFFIFFVPSLIRHTLNIYEETLKLIEKNINILLLFSAKGIHGLPYCANDTEIVYKHIICMTIYYLCITMLRVVVVVPERRIIVYIPDGKSIVEIERVD